MILLGIDPGKSGGFAVRQTDDTIKTHAMPETVSEIVALIRELAGESNHRVAYLEQVTGYIPGRSQPGSAMFSFGLNYGVLQGLLIGFGFELHDVRPQKWQKALECGTKGGRGDTEWKRLLKDKAVRLFPGVKVTNATADALLILDYGMRDQRLAAAGVEGA